MYSTLPRPLTETFEMSCKWSVSNCPPTALSCTTYLDLEVGVKQELEFEALLAFIAYSNDCLKCVLAQCDTVDQSEVQRPRFAVLFADAVAIKTKVELHRAGVQGVLRRRLAQVFPTRVACESMLRELRGRAFFGRWTEDLLCS